MSNPDATQVFDSCDPLVDSGQTIAIRLEQTLTRPKPGGGEDMLLETTGALDVHVRVDGPKVGLLDSDVVGVYPSPGSDNSPDEFLPHIALTRRTLPWERTGPAADKPWLALIVLKESEIGARFTQGAGPSPITSTTVGQLKASHPAAHARFQASGLSDGEAIQVVLVPTTILKSILAIDDLEWLCHVRRVAQDNPLARLDDDRDLAIVVSGRLPDASDVKPQLHYAYLVSLEERTDLQNPTGTTTPLIVLHHWSFTPSKGGDFEQVIKAIRARPNGGVLRFGNLPRDHTGSEPELSADFAALLDDHGYLIPPTVLHQTGEPVEYRSPLRPFPPPVRSRGFAVRPAPEEFVDSDPGDPADYSHATAFEIGRLATLADDGLVDDLRRIRYGALRQEIELPILVDQLPDALRKHGWVMDDLWWDDRFSLPGGEQLIKTAGALAELGEADFTGIEAQGTAWKQTIVAQVDKLAGVAQGPASQIDVGTIDGQTLNELFAEVVSVARGL
jgi:hypothetical protein